MSTYRTEINYQVFDQTGHYTPVTPFEKADCEENFPGGKWGVHPQTPPAINADGSRYIFPWVNQLAYITHKVSEVLALGGKTTPTGYQLPVQATASAAMVFYPDYAIAYYPPAKESTVSTNICRRRADRSGLLTPEPRDPINFVRTS
jgi:hypothetical protein